MNLYFNENIVSSEKVSFESLNTIQLKNDNKKIPKAHKVFNTILTQQVNEMLYKDNQQCGLFTLNMISQTINRMIIKIIEKYNSNSVLKKNKIYLKYDDVLFLYKGGNLLRLKYLKFVTKYIDNPLKNINKFETMFKISDADFSILINPNKFNVHTFKQFRLELCNKLLKTLMKLRNNVLNNEHLYIGSFNDNKLKEIVKLFNESPYIKNHDNELENYQNNIDVKQCIGIIYGKHKYFDQKYTPNNIAKTTTNDDFNKLNREFKHYIINLDKPLYATDAQLIMTNITYFKSYYNLKEYNINDISYELDKLYDIANKIRDKLITPFYNKISNNIDQTDIFIETQKNIINLIEKYEKINNIAEDTHNIYKRILYNDIHPANIDINNVNDSYKKDVIIKTHVTYFSKKTHNIDKEIKKTRYSSLLNTGGRIFVSFNNDIKFVTNQITVDFSLARMKLNFLCLFLDSNDQKIIYPMNGEYIDISVQGYDDYPLHVFFQNDISLNIEKMKGNINGHSIEINGYTEIYLFYDLNYIFEAHLTFLWDDYKYYKRWNKYLLLFVILVDKYFEKQDILKLYNFFKKISYVFKPNNLTNLKEFINYYKNIKIHIKNDIHDIHNNISYNKVTQNIINIILSYVCIFIDNFINKIDENSHKLYNIHMNNIYDVYMESFLPLFEDLTLKHIDNNGDNYNDIFYEFKQFGGSQYN
jgi:hypothetical protein